MAPPPEAAPTDPMALLRTSAYVRLLVLTALIGLPISALAYGFLELVAELQTLLFDDLPGWLGFDSPPSWWPIPLLAVSGLLTALAIVRLPGTGGHSPVDGLKAGGGGLPPAELPGVILAALATLSFGVVLGPEAPLIAIGSGLGVLAIRLASRDAPDRVTSVVAAAGSFAAISSLLGSPLIAAFLLLEAAGLAGPMLGIVLVPGLLAAGIGTIIFLGLDDVTGLGTFTLAIPDLPAFERPTLALLGWAVVVGGAAPFLGHAIQTAGRALRARVQPRMVLLMPVLGVGIGVLAVFFHEVTDHSISNVLFSGQDQIGPLISGAAGWSVGALLLLIVCKGAAYALALSSFRGGPVFPAIFLGAAGGLAMADLPGMELVPAIAMGMGAMSVVMLRLPLTSVMLATILMGADGLAAIPLVIISVVVAFVIAARLQPPPQGERTKAAGPAAARSAVPAT